MDIVVLDTAVGHTLVNIFVAYPTRRDLVERVARQDLVPAIEAERRNRDRAPRTKFVPFALETHGALSHRSDRFLVECVKLAFKKCAGLGPSISLLCA